MRGARQVDKGEMGRRYAEGPLQIRQSSGLREIRGGRPQRMSVWILRFTNGPGQRWWAPYERNMRSAISQLFPANAMLISTVQQVTIAEG